MHSMLNPLFQLPGSEVYCEYPGAVHYEGFTYNAPGTHDWDEVELQGAEVYDWQASQIGGRGPDGDGDDELIKNPAQFLDCMTEVVRTLSSIEVFGWETPVIPMPDGVFEALRKSPSLTGLRLKFSAFSGKVSMGESCATDESSCALL